MDIGPEAEEYPIASFLLHPLIENAVKYGMSTSPLPLVIHLKAKIADCILMIEVNNTGKWVKPGDQKGQVSTGTGLENVRLRLENAFPNRHRLEIVEKEGRVHIKLEIRKFPGRADEKTL